ncbi:hypothetical protein ACHAWC_001313 [Mediolabrus comicus]
MMRTAAFCFLVKPFFFELGFLRRHSPQQLRHRAEEDTDDVTCYITNDEEIINDGEKPHVVCTSEKEEYAWFNGIDPKNMRETDGVVEGAESCVEGENYRGKPEWECD